jgi:hypothetical protein
MARTSHGQTINREAASVFPLSELQVHFYRGLTRGAREIRLLEAITKA